MTWSKPPVSGRPPPPSRAHSCNYVERKTENGVKRELYVFGGGDGPYYFNDVHMLDTGKITLSFFSLVCLCNRSFNFIKNR